MILRREGNPEVLFIPPIPSAVYTKHYEDFMPLGLLALSASLRAGDLTPAIYRPTRPLFNRSAIKETARNILEIGAPIIGFSTWCHSYPASLLLANEIKALHPDVTIVFGGPQASLLDVKTLHEYLCVDFVLRGEADNTITELVGHLLRKSNQQELSEISGLSYRQPGTQEIQRNQLDRPNRDLDHLPLPAYDLIVSPTDFFSLDVGRGCPYECTFCTTNSFFSRLYRVKSIERIIFEMDYLFDSYGVSQFGFCHDMFTARRDWVLNFCNKLSEHGLKSGRKYHWSCSARIDCVTEELLSEMARVGCRSIFFGIETGSERMQKTIKKRLNIQNAYENLRLCEDFGISATTAFIMGFPQETREDLDATLEAVVESAGHGAKPQVSILSVQPQTPIHDEFKEQLLFDGLFADFSANICGPDERKMISGDPEMFSSFYYLPIEATDRRSLLTINRIVNLYEHFENTFKILYPTLAGLKDSVSLLSMVEDFFSNNMDREKLGNDVLVLFLAAITRLVKYVRSATSEEAPCFLEDVLLAEASMALMCQRFLKCQILNPRKSKLTSPIRQFDATDVVVPTQFWDVIETQYNLESIMAGYLSNQPKKYKWYRRGRYAYLVIAKSEKHGTLFKMKSWQRKVISVLDKPTIVRDLFAESDQIAEREMVERLLRKLVAIGALSFPDTPSSLSVDI